MTSLQLRRHVETLWGVAHDLDTQLADQASRLAVVELAILDRSATFDEQIARMKELQAVFGARMRAGGRAIAGDL